MTKDSPIIVMNLLLLAHWKAFLIRRSDKLILNGPSPNFTDPLL